MKPTDATTAVTPLPGPTSPEAAWDIIFGTLKDLGERWSKAGQPENKTVVADNLGGTAATTVKDDKQHKATRHETE